MLYELTNEQAGALCLAAEGELEASWPDEYAEAKQNLREAMAVLTTRNTENTSPENTSPE